MTLALADIVLYNDGEQGETKQWPAIVSDGRVEDDGPRWLLTVFRPRGIFWVWVDNEPGDAWGQWSAPPKRVNVDEWGLRTGVPNGAIGAALVQNEDRSANHG